MQNGVGKMLNVSETSICPVCNDSVVAHSAGLIPLCAECRSSLHPSEQHALDLAQSLRVKARQGGGTRLPARVAGLLKRLGNKSA